MIEVLMEPKSLVHAKAEEADLRKSIKVMEELRVKGSRYFDVKQFSIDQKRLSYLRLWIKAQTDGNDYPCRNCVILEELYKKLKNDGVDDVKEWLLKKAFGKDYRLVDSGAKGEEVMPKNKLANDDCKEPCGYLDSVKGVCTLPRGKTCAGKLSWVRKSEGRDVVTGKKLK